MTQLTEFWILNRLIGRLPTISQEHHQEDCIIGLKFLNYINQTVVFFKKKSLHSTININVDVGLQTEIIKGVPRNFVLICLCMQA